MPLAHPSRCRKKICANIKAAGRKALGEALGKQAAAVSPRIGAITRSFCQKARQTYLDFSDAEKIGKLYLARRTQRVPRHNMLKTGAWARPSASLACLAREYLLNSF